MSKRSRGFWYLRLTAPDTRPHLVYVAGLHLDAIGSIVEEYRSMGWDVSVDR